MTAATRITLVAARAANGVIGAKGNIPWRIPEDFAHFKRVTVGHPLVLGRTTFEGIGRPLPHRQSIVVTRNSEWSYEGVLVAGSVEEALGIGGRLDEVVNVGGGAQVYRDTIAFAQRQILTEVHLEPEGDTHYPDFEESEWFETRREQCLEHEPPYEIRWLERRSAS